MILAGLCVVCLSGCGRSKAVTEEQLRLRSQGMEQALAGEYDAAVASYDEALALSDMRAGSLELDIAAYKASALYHQGKSQEAVDTCTAILDLKKSAEIYLTRGLLYREMGDTEAAKEDFSRALERTSSKDKLMLGRLSYYMEDYAKAKEYLEAVTAEGNNEGLYWQAELYHQMGNEDYAVTLYQNYLQGEVAYVTAYARVVSWQIRQGEYDDALKTISAGLEKTDAVNRQQLLAYEIAIYEQKGDFETAKLKMESYLESYPDDEEAAREWIFLKTR